MNTIAPQGIGRQQQNTCERFVCCASGCSVITDHLPSGTRRCIMKHLGAGMPADIMQECRICLNIEGTSPTIITLGARSV